MAIVINGSGTVTGLAVGGLPDDTVDAGTLANSINTEITANTAKTGITSSQATAITAALPKAGGDMTGPINITANQTSMTFNTPSSGQNSWMIWKDNGTSKWELNKNTANELSIYSYVTSAPTMIFKPDGRGVSQFTAKGWCKFTGVSTTAILDSHNVSSITDNGTGSTIVIWDVNLSNANYAVGTNAPKPGGTASASNSNHCNVGEAAAGQILFETNRADGITKRDLPENSVIAFGD